MKGKALKAEGHEAKQVHGPQVRLSQPHLPRAGHHSSGYGWSQLFSGIKAFVMREKFQLLNQRADAERFSVVAYCILK